VFCDHTVNRDLIEAQPYVQPNNSLDYLRPVLSVLFVAGIARIAHPRGSNKPMKVLGAFAELLTLFSISSQGAN